MMSEPLVLVFQRAVMSADACVNGLANAGVSRMGRGKNTTATRQAKGQEEGRGLGHPAALGTSESRCFNGSVV